MATRQPGSGLANVSAAAVEDLLAAVLRSDDADVEVQRDRLQYECSIDRCGMDPDVIVDLVVVAAAGLGLDVADAFAQPLDRLGDVKAVLADGQPVWFEVKAQTKKDRFGDLTQADWVRDDTDFLRWLFHHDVGFANAMPRSVAAFLRVPRPETYFQGWDRDLLWLADMGLVSSRADRERTGVRTTADLIDFLDQKFVVHLTREGIRIVRLSLLTPVAAVLAGTPAAVSLNYANQTAASIALACPGPTGHGRVHFTYHLYDYPTGVIGRHKMHALSLVTGPNTIEVRA